MVFIFVFGTGLLWRLYWFGGLVVEFFGSLEVGDRLWWWRVRRRQGFDCDLDYWSDCLSWFVNFVVS